MTTWAEWRENAKTPFRKGEVVRMEDGKAYKAKVPAKVAKDRQAPAHSR